MTQNDLSSLAPFLSHQFHEHKALVILIIIGMVAGLISQMILPGRGFGMVSTMVIGIAGAWLGDKYIKAHLIFINDATLRKVAAAIAGAMILSIIINLVRGGADRDKTHWRHN